MPPLLHSSPTPACSSNIDICSRSTLFLQSFPLFMVARLLLTVKKVIWKLEDFYQLGVTKIICLWLRQFCQKHDLRIEVAHANESIIWIFYKVCLLHWSSLNREYIITLRSTKRGPLNISSVQAKIGLSQTHKVIGKLENCASILFLFENAAFPSW